MGRVNLSGRKLVFGFLFLFLFVSVVSAADFDYLITNSEDWKDVYSGVHYATLNDAENDFMVSVNHGNVLAKAVEKNRSIFVATSRRSEFISNYGNYLKGVGVEDVEEVSSRNLNLELAQDLDVENFIVVDPSYGYSAIAVTPYAVQTNSWVFLADRNNIDEIDSILAQKNVNNILVYGYVDDEVRETLDKYSPEIIYNQDRFQDNIDIVKKYSNLNPTGQILLTNGDFIEKELMLGKYPIVFTGRKTVPEKIAEYLTDSDFTVGVLIGNELVDSATNIRRDTGIYVIVKFARGARGQNAGIASVEGLDLFSVPSPILNLSIHSVAYNKLSENLEVVYRSGSNVPIYLRDQVSIDDKRFSREDSEDIVFISPNEYKTVLYKKNSDTGVIESYEDLIVELEILYGESKDSLDRILREQREVTVVEVVDRCEAEVVGVKYNKQDNLFKIKLKNKGDFNCYASASLVDVISGYDEEILYSEEVVLIEKSKTEEIIIEKELDEEDLEKNEYVNLVVSYGEKETNLVKTISGSFEVKIEKLTVVMYAIVGVLILLGLFTSLFFWRKKKEEKEFDF